jgi:1,4-alpha-glucan branching enzyme
MDGSWGGYISLILHGHLPFVRHPEHEKFLEESWLFEAILESYIPLLQVLERWEEEGLKVTVTVTLTPTLCSMLADPLLQQRHMRRFEALIELADKERHRTRGNAPLHELAQFYCKRFGGIREYYCRRKGDLLGVFRSLQECGRVEIMTSAATHALLPLLAHHSPSVRAQVLVGRDHYLRCFGCAPRGIWLPECAYVEALEPVFREAELRWFITDTHGLLHARPRPRCGVFAPILTPNGLAAFGREKHSARQVWSREQGYPADARYRDFYRDIGFDLDLDYLQSHLPAPEQRGFTGIKYHRVTDRSAEKQCYDRRAAVEAAAEHADHFLKHRKIQIRKLSRILEEPPILICPYDTELFGHWWYEGPEFLDQLVRQACSREEQIRMITPDQYLGHHGRLQVAEPGASSWGEEGYWGVWLNERNAWIYPHLNIAQQRMMELAETFAHPDKLEERALQQAARELLLAQASDWPFILSAGTNVDYARNRVETHLFRFTQLFEQITAREINPQQLEAFEKQDNIFPGINYLYYKRQDETG